MQLMLTPLRERYFPQGLPEGTRHYRTGPTLDQGETGTCTAFCATHRTHASPIMQQLPFKNGSSDRLSPFDLYRLIVSIDEYVDNDGEATLPDDQLQMGSSARAAAEALKKLGIIKSYLHAESVEDIRAWHLAGFGGLMLGTTWYDHMFDPDTDGFVSPTGSVAGGHSYASCGWNDHVSHNGKTVRAMLCQNNWSKSWGLKGFFWMEESTLEKLFADGEWIAPLEVRVKPATHANPISTAWDYIRPKQA